MTAPRGLVIAAAASHSGKTTMSLGLIAALRARGLTIAAAKCGPDYIDPKFLAAASGAPAINLDPWAMPADTVRARLARHASGSDMIVVEGVMGLFDGGSNGAGSTASLAALTGLPVVLIIGAQGLAQSAAAVAEGCKRLADGCEVVGAIVNQVASDRHADLIREGFERSSVPLLGLVRRDPSIALPSRHLGLVQAEEHTDLAAKITRAAEMVEQGCDVERLVKCAGLAVRAESFSQWEKVAVKQPDEGTRCPGSKHNAEHRTPSPARSGCTLSPRERVGARETRLTPLGQRIAVARDIAFAFTYPHLLQDWREEGAEIVFFSPLADEGPDADADAIFLPGGYPELHAARVAAATRFHTGMQAAAERGALIYGECGGYMVLGESLTDEEGQAHRMLGLLPVATSFARRKLHLGYRRLQPIGELPWSVPLTAHEFHFASIVAEAGADPLFQAQSADGTTLGPIGLRRGRVMGSFAHIIDAGS